MVSVPERGLEPPHPYGHRFLKPARLPIPPLRHTKHLLYQVIPIWTDIITSTHLHKIEAKIVQLFPNQVPYCDLQMDR